MGGDGGMEDANANVLMRAMAEAQANMNDGDLQELIRGFQQ